MTQVPRTQYARTPDGVHIAYQVSGRGSIDLVYTAGFALPSEACWEGRTYGRFLERLSSFSRLITFDRRGVGLSDPVSPSSPPTMELWADDVLAVLDDVGSERSAIFGWDTLAGPAAILFAATHPARTSSLILVNAPAKGAASPDYPHGLTVEEFEQNLDFFRRNWGTLEWADPSFPEEERDWLIGSARRGASPSMAIALYRVGYDTDVRDVLPSINVPTLVMHTSRRRFRRGAEYLAERIPRARLVPLESRETFIWLGDTRQLVDEVEEFLTGTRSEAESDRVLATVLFSDIVSSTRRTTEIGDRRWREIIERHDSMARRHVDRFRGRYVKATGDGILATFDGPARAINCARDMRDTITRSLGIELRFGLHTGEIEPREDDITGIAVHIGQRVSALAGAGEILVSRTVTDLVAGSGLEFEDRGDHELKGVLGRWRLFAVKS